MNSEYDERQLAVRHRLGYQAFMLMMILVAVNAFVLDVVYIWANTTVSSFVILLTVSAYFGARSIAEGAYFTDKIQKTKFLMIFMSIMACFFAVMLIILVIIKHISIIENGMATLDLVFVMSVISMMFIAISSIINWKRRMREEK